MPTYQRHKNEKPVISILFEESSLILQAIQKCGKLQNIPRKKIISRCRVMILFGLNILNELKMIQNQYKSTCCSRELSAISQVDKPLSQSFLVKTEDLNLRQARQQTKLVLQQLVLSSNRLNKIRRNEENMMKAANREERHELKVSKLSSSSTTEGIDEEEKKMSLKLCSSHQNISKHFKVQTQHSEQIASEQYRQASLTERIGKLKELRLAEKESLKTKKELFIAMIQSKILSCVQDVKQFHKSLSEKKLRRFDDQKELIAKFKEKLCRQEMKRLKKLQFQEQYLELYKEKILSQVNLLTLTENESNQPTQIVQTPQKLSKMKLNSHLCMNSLSQMF